MGGFINQTATGQRRFGRRAAPPPLADYLPPAPPATPLSPSSAPQQPAPARDFDTQAVIARTFRLMAQNGVTFLALVAAAAVPERLAYHLLGDSPVVMALLYVLTALSCVPLYGAIFIGAMLTLAGGKASFKTCFRAGMRQSWPAALLSLLTALFVWLLLIVPGFALATRWAVAAPAAIVEGLGLRAAMTRSAALTAPHRRQISVLVLLLAATAVSRALPMLAIWHMPASAVLPFMLGNWLFPLLLTAFTAAASAALYYELRPVKRTEAAAGVPPLVVQPAPNAPPRIFKEGTSWPKKILGSMMMGAIFLALGLIVASQLFNSGRLALYGVALFGAVAVPVLAWVQYRKATDPAFAAQVAAARAKRPK